MQMFFKKKQKEMKAITKPTNEGIKIDFIIKNGREETSVSLPLSREEIEHYYRIPGFMAYIAWEELYDSGLIENGIFSYDSYYQILESEEGSAALTALNLPSIESEIFGELRLNSTPHEADLVLKLKL